jgi:hypothetical protein
MKNEVIYEDDHLVCIFQPGTRSDALIFTFSEMLMRPSPDHRIWAGVPIKNLGFAAIGFVAKKPNWFPKESVHNAFALIQDLLASYGQRIGYGYSMGGWAVLYYAKKLLLDATISFSPQFSINPDEISDHRFSKHFQQHLNSGMSINKNSGAAINILACDPVDRGDWESATKISNHINVEIVPLHYLGHGSVRCVTSTKALSDILSAVAAHDKNRAIGAIKACRRSASIRPMQIACKIANKSPAIAFSIYIKYKDSFPMNSRAPFLYKLRKTRFQRQCLREIFEIYKLMKGNASYLAILASFLDDIDRKDVAKICIKRAIKIQDNPHLHHIAKTICR